MLTDEKSKTEEDLTRLFTQFEVQGNLDAIFNAIAEGITVQNKLGRVVFANDAAAQIMGYRDRNEIIDKDPGNLLADFEILNEQRQPYPLDALPGRRVLAGVESETVVVIWLNKKTNQQHWSEIKARPIRDINGTVRFVVNVFRDITLQKKSEEAFQYQYHHDTLTDLPNRLFLIDRFEKALRQAEAGGKSVALALIDLDRFKQINESLGHALGDRLIQEVALRLRSCVREDHVLARLGGDEFGILLPNIEAEKDIADLAGKILEDFRPAYYLDAQELYISTSIGISLYPYDGKEPSILLQNAEAALYRAKDHGRNNYQFYTKTLNATAYERLTMESKMRHAIDNNEFVVYYEPQIDLNNGKIVGVESLIRWQQQDGSLVSPDRFIPLAEASGLIEPIGAFALHESLRQGKIWHDHGFKISVAVNLSARQFKQKDFERFLITEIEESQFDPSFLELELTESMLAENAEVIINIMNALRNRGVKFCLDDFSTGHSSLRYIKQFPVDVLKVERNFMKGIPSDIQNLAIVKSILTLGQSLGMEVTAEGVESKTQLGFLRDHLCNRAQGYLFNGALPANLMTEILGEDRYVAVVANLGSVGSR
jgi:diguanylate cyclase (GGDEF)-like protein/PAS domain S-box-containing protein